MTTGPAWYSATDIAGLPGMPGSERAVNRMCERREINRRPRNQGKGWEYHINDLPPITQAALVRRYRATESTPATDRVDHYDRATVWAQYDLKPDKQKNVAQQRLAALNTALTLIATGLSRARAFTEAGAAHQVSAASLYRWHETVRAAERSDWLALLAPGYVGRVAHAECSVEAWDYFKADFLRLEKPAAAACYERLMRAATVHNWTVPAQITLERRLEREIPRSVHVLARDGKEALKRTYPAQERDHSVFHALEAVNADGHKFDLFARWPDGTIARPVIVAWQDIYSGKLLSYRVDHTEHSGLVRLSFGDMVEQFGIPSSAYLDNGRAFATKFLTGGTATRYRFKIREDDPVGIFTNLLGPSGVHWTTPYHGQAKPIERAWRDLCEYVAKHPLFAGAYTGNNPTAKPENYASHAVPLAEFLAVLDQEIIAHNARVGRRSKVCAGQSFDVVFNASYARAPIRKATEEQRRLWLLAADGVTASRQDGAVRIFGNRYWCEALGQYAGKKVVVRFDPDRLQEAVHIYTLDGRHIGTAECIVAAGFNSESAARDQARAVKQYNKAARQMRDAEIRIDAGTAARFLPAAEPTPTADSRVVQLQFGDQNKKSTEADAVLAAEQRGNHDENFRRAVSDLQDRLRKNAL